MAAYKMAAVKVTPPTDFPVTDMSSDLVIDHAVELIPIICLLI
jgi:hypothetical protein